MLTDMCKYTHEQAHVSLSVQLHACIYEQVRVWVYLHARVCIVKCLLISVLYEAMRACMHHNMYKKECAWM